MTIKELKNRLKEIAVEAKAAETSGDDAKLDKLIEEANTINDKIERAQKLAEITKNATAAGFKPDIVLDISEFEYNGENFCILAGQRYKIYRTFSAKDTERMELYLTAVVGETNVTPESS